MQGSLLRSDERGLCLEDMIDPADGDKIAKYILQTIFFILSIDANNAMQGIVHITYIHTLYIVLSQEAAGLHIMKNMET